MSPPPLVRFPRSLLLAGFVAAAASAAAAPVISEIMFHSPSVPEDTRQEWLELYNNPGTGDVDLGGWKFTKGVTFTFPAGTVLREGSCLIVAADAAAFQAAHPGFAGAVTGGWTGRLSNAGETVRLDDAAGREVDEIRYADEGDWALRARPVIDPYNHQGWVWESPADGGGKTLERKSLTNPGDFGQNWRFSEPAGGTPGFVYAFENMVGIRDVRHTPAIPRSTQPVTVQARVIDAPNGTVLPTQTLFWRRDGDAAFTSVPMTITWRNGPAPWADIHVEAVIPAQIGGTIVEYYIQATGDLDDTATWPAPARTSAPGVVPEVFDQATNALYAVDDTAGALAWSPGDRPTYRLVMKAVERNELRSIQTINSQKDSDAEMNATFISVDGDGVEVKHLTSVRNRGFSSRLGPPNNFHLSFRHDDLWRDRAGMQMNCRYPHSQVLAANCFELAGLPQQSARPARLLINNISQAETGSRMFGTFARVESLNGDWAARHYPEDSAGNLYRLDDHNPNSAGAIPGDLGSGEFRYEGTNPLAYADTFEKLTNREENDWSDLIGLARVVSAPVTGGSVAQPAVSDADYPQKVRELINVEEWFTYLAMDALVGNQEGGLPTGRADDFSIYRGVLDPRFVLIPHDFDTCFDLNDDGISSPVNRSIFSFHTGNASLLGLQRLFTHPHLVPVYYQKMLYLVNNVFTREKLDPIIDDLLTGWVSAPVINGVKSYIDARRINVLSQIPQTYSLTTNLTAGTGGYLQSSTGAVDFSGTFHAAEARSLRLNGQPVTLNYRTLGAETAGTWRFSATSGSGFLNRGLTRVTANFYDGPNGTGNVVHTESRDIYYGGPAGSSMTEVSGTLSAVTAPDSVTLTVPDSYKPGVPVLVRVDARAAGGALERSAWNRTAVLTAPNGLILSPATVTLFNGMGSALVNISSTATGAQVLPLITAGGTLAAPGANAPLWRILDSGGDPGTAWRNPGFDDSAWRQGPLEAGTGDGDERTVTANLSATRRGFYFRNVFSVATTSGIAGLRIRAVIDDGAVFYLNGTEVYRDNMPEDPLDVTTAASTTRAGTAETQIRTFDISAFTGLLHAGENTLAVRVHNASTTADLSFDCALEGLAAVADPGNFILTANVDGRTATAAVASLAQTVPQEVSGTLPAAPVTWSGLVRVTGDVTVPAGGSLTIAAGATVLMDGNATPGDSTGSDLIVNGSLTIDGTAARPVSITCSDANARWGELVFLNARPSTLRYALITRGGRSPGRGHTGKGPLVRLSASAVTFEDCAMGDSPAKAMYTSGNSDPVLRRTLIARTITGPELSDGASLLVEDSNIQQILPEYRESDSPAPDDEDCLYVHNSPGRPVIVRRSVFARCGDDVFDCLAGPITVEDSILREGWDKGMSLLNNDLILTRTLIVDCDKAIVPKSNSATTRTVTADHATIICQDHDTTTAPWGYAIPPSSPDPDSPSTGLYTQNKSGQSHAGATLAIMAKNCLILAKEPIKIDAPYAAANTVVTYSALIDEDTPDAPVWPGTGNITAEPRLENLASRRLTPLSTSPVRDTGDPASALDNDGSRTDMGAIPALTAPSAPGEQRWTVANSPYLLTGNVTVPAGVTLRIDPGVSVFARQNRRLTVRGRLIAAGTEAQHITFSSVPGSVAAGDADPVKNGVQTGPPKWGGVRIYDSMTQENVVAWADFIDAQGTSPSGEENHGSIGFIRSWGLVEHCTWAGTHLRMCYGRNSKLTVRRSVFPDMFLFDPVLNRIENPSDFVAAADNSQEPLKMEYPTTDPEVTGNSAYANGQPAGGWWRVYYNDFYGNRGHNDVFDADSGRWGQAGQYVLDCRYNHFHGLSGDEHIDLGGDAYIASNIFERAIKDEWTSDTGYSNAISSGDKGTGTTILVARNVFTDLDHAINLKANTGTIFEHNTVANFHADYSYSGISFGTPFTQAVKCAPINVFIPEDGASPTLGDGGWMGWNLISNVPRMVSGADSRKSGNNVVHDVTTKLEFGPNLFHALGTTALGPNHPGGLFAPAYSGNKTGEPGFADAANGDFSLVPGSDALGTAPGGLDYGATVPEWAYITGGPSGKTSAATASFTIGGPGIVAYKWKLDNGAWSAPVTIGAGGLFPRSGATVRQAVLNLTSLSNGPHTLSVLGQDMAGNWQDNDPAVESGQPQAAPTTRVWNVDSAFQEVVISEILTQSALGTPDSIELTNRGGAAVSIGGWRLTDDASATGGGYTVPAGTSIPAGGWLTFTSAVTQLGLGRDGDSVFLYNSGGALVDSITFGPQIPDLTLSRTGESWTLGTPTFGTANAPVKLGDPAAVRISEWFAASGGVFANDWVELKNPSALPVALGGLSLTDNTLTGSPVRPLPPHSYIAASGYAVFIADSDPERGANHLDFSLDSEQEALALYAGGRLLDIVVFGPATRDVSRTRTAANGPAWSVVPTFGFDLPSTSPVYQNALNLLRGLRITEIMYDPQDGGDYEFVELTNISGIPLDLTGVAFTEGIQFTFPSMILAPGAQVVAVANAGLFTTRYGAGPVVAGAYSGKLDNSGETLTLSLPPPFGERILSFHYTPDWQPSTRGLGRSLELGNTATAPRDFEDWTAWRASASPLGSPGADSIPAPVTFQAWLDYYQLTAAALLLDADGDGLSNLLEYGLGTNPRINARGHGADMTPAISPAAGAKSAITFTAPVSGQPGGYGTEGVTYVIEDSGDLSAWRPIAQKTPDSAVWTALTLPAATLETGIPALSLQPLTVISGDALTSGTARRYLRLRVIR
ncbi:MAG: lamin tail domain-containing protein [Verrucomicrobiota bacterium]